MSVADAGEGEKVACHLLAGCIGEEREALGRRLAPEARQVRLPQTQGPDV